MSSFGNWLNQQFEQVRSLIHYREFAIISLCCTILTIWKGRNQKIFEGKDSDPMGCLYRIRLFISNYIKDLNSNSEHRVRGINQNQGIGYWSPPITGVIKINTDTSFNNLTGFGFAWILAWDHTGQVVAGLTQKNYAPNALTAEALALRDTMFFVDAIHLQRIVLESDSLELIQACRGKIKRVTIMHLNTFGTWRTNSKLAISPRPEGKEMRWLIP